MNVEKTGVKGIVRIKLYDKEGNEKQESDDQSKTKNTILHGKAVKMFFKDPA